jgi:hypothetical protein
LPNDLRWTDSLGRSLDFDYTGEESLNAGQHAQLLETLQSRLLALTPISEPIDVDRLAAGIIKVATDLQLECSPEMAREYAKHVTGVVSWPILTFLALDPAILNNSAARDRRTKTLVAAVNQLLAKAPTLSEDEFRGAVIDVAFANGFEADPGRALAYGQWLLTAPAEFRAKARPLVQGVVPSVATDADGIVFVMLEHRTGVEKKREQPA